MTRIKINKTKNYTLMSNAHLRDMKLSLKAVGLLSKMLSLPENWDYSVEGLCKICKDGYKSIQSGLKELEDNKYLIRNKKQNDKGQFEYEYIIYEEPYPHLPSTEEPSTVEPSTVKERQLNTNILITNNKLLNNNNIMSSSEEQDNIPYKEIIDYLNNKTNKHFKYTQSNKDKIKARYNQGFNIDDFKKVIDIKTKEWLKNEKMNCYLRPDTLFGSKFESYLNQQEIKSDLERWLEDD